MTETDPLSAFVETLHSPVPSVSAVAYHYDPLDSVDVVRAIRPEASVTQRN
jgi:hypothetical protein